MITKYIKLINNNMHKMFKFEKVTGEKYSLLKTQCLKDHSHYMYYNENTHVFSCPICNFKLDLLSLCVEIQDVPNLYMLRTIVNRKLHKDVTEITNVIESNLSIKALMYKINEDACEFFKSELTKCKKATQYIKDRKLDEVTDVFQIGFAPFGNKLLEHLTGLGYSIDILNEVGLIGISDDDKPYDVFRGRLMFPIFDKDNNIIAFGGRTIYDSPKKYINTKTTPIFYKSRDLYGIENLNEKVPFIIVSEGYMDVIAMRKAGFNTVVGNLGTAITKHHLKILQKYTKNIIVMLDGDDAGQKAMNRTLKQVGKVNTVILPNNLDPDEFLQKHSPRELFNYIKNNKKSWLDIMLNEFGNKEERINVFEHLLDCEKDL